jgi:hypothetical protein
LDAETGSPRSPPETTDTRRDQKVPKPKAEIAAQTAYLNLTRKYPVSRDWMVVQAVSCEPVSRRKFPEIREFTGKMQCSLRLNGYGDTIIDVDSEAY